MKQNLLCLICLLVVWHLTFSMEKENKELVSWKTRILQSFQDYEKEAKNYESKGSLQAFFFYGKLVEELIPFYSTSPDPYAEIRKIQNEAYNKISFKADELQKEQKYEDALKIYKFAPRAFASTIKELSKKKNEKQKD